MSKIRKETISKFYGWDDCPVREMVKIDNKELFRRLAEKEERLLQIIHAGRRAEEDVIMYQQEVARRGLLVTDTSVC